jgi:hypothetical protein
MSSEVDGQKAVGAESGDGEGKFQFQWTNYHARVLWELGHSVAPRTGQELQEYFNPREFIPREFIRTLQSTDEWEDDGLGLVLNELRCGGYIRLLRAGYVITASGLSAMADSHTDVPQSRGTARPHPARDRRRKRPTSGAGD